MNAISYTALRASLSSTMERVCVDHNPVIITKKRDPSVVMISLEDYESIEDITYNKAFSEITLLVDQEKFDNSFDGFVALGLGITSSYYQIFNGISPDKYKVTIFFKDANTEEVLHSVVYPDAFEEID